MKVRFEIRHLPEWLAARDYRKGQFAAQGYRLIDHQNALSLRSTRST